MSSSVPHFKNVEDAPYKLDKLRRQRLVNKFKSLFQEEPACFSRSPGRVNLMGDHIDYCYFSVLPMAIEADIIAAVSQNDSRNIIITNTDTNFPDETIELDHEGNVISIDQDNFSWASYFKCAIIVAHNFLLERYPHIVSSGSKQIKGMNITFDGTVPTGGGLSSSAAFCVASTLAILRSNGIFEVTKEDLTRITVVSEHYVGVSTGGMDQCASVYGEENKALLIHFKPTLTGVPFSFPVVETDQMVFLITNTLVKANKHESSPVNYNLRVVEVAIAADLLAHRHKLDLPQDSNLKTGTLRGFLDVYFTRKLNEPPWDGLDVDVGIKRLNELLDLIEFDFTDSEKKGFTTSRVIDAIGLSTKTFESRYLEKYPVKFDILKLYQRTKHVFSEALRVLQFINLTKNCHGDASNFLEELGILFNESQKSFQINYNSSTPELDKLCEISKNNGSFGSRTTGAGFGGSAVHVTTVSRLKKLKQALVNDYYKNKFPNISDQELNEAIVVTKPAAGTFSFDRV